MENEDYYEELSDQQVEVGQQEVVVGVVAPQPINIPSEVQVVPANNPESPSPSLPSPSQPSPAGSPAASPPASPGPGSPQPQFGDALTFMGFFSADDITELEQWAVDAQSLRGTPDLRLEEPEISANFKTFLKFVWGHQWELKFIQPAGEVLICKLRAYLAGYLFLTNFNRRQWLRLFPAWTVQERREQLQLLTASGGLLEL